MLLTSLTVDPAEFAQRTGWTIKPEGACREDVCVPLPGSDPSRPDARTLSERLGMPLVEDATHGLWSLGPESAGRALTTAVAPELTLPDVNGTPFHLRSLLGQKVLVVAWASW